MGSFHSVGLRKTCYFQTANSHAKEGTVTPRRDEVMELASAEQGALLVCTVPECAPAVFMLG